MATGTFEKFMKHILFLVLTLLALPVQAQECPRIISQAPYITHSLQWLGLEQCIVGTSRYDSLGLPHTGGILDPDKQAIDDLMPDIIFTSNWISDADMRQATPTGVRYFRLQGFYTMAGIEANLLTIGKEVGIKDIAQHIQQFHRDWQQAIRQIDARGKRALLISSCSGSPYSFGKQTWLYDLFNQVGFSMVETHARIRHIKPGQEIEELTSLLNILQPDVMFIFERKLNSKCNLVLPKVPVRIVALDGQHFLHPAPVLLEGLRELNNKQRLWQ